MLDVHPPHEAAHTWKDFFIHVGTICVGLLIAIGLEQSVEALHRHSELIETRKALAEEREQNREIFRRAVAGSLIDAARLHNDIRVFTYLARHPGTPQAKLPGVIVWTDNVFAPNTSAWDAAGHANTLSLLPKDELNKHAATYFELQRALDSYSEVTQSIVQAAAYSTGTDDPATMSSQQIQHVIDLLEQASIRESLFAVWMQNIAADQPDFQPLLTDQQVFRYCNIHSVAELQTKYPEAFAWYARDLKDAELQDTGQTGK
jgi:hypothetical protein